MLDTLYVSRDEMDARLADKDREIEELGELVDEAIGAAGLAQSLIKHFQEIAAKDREMKETLSDTLVALRVEKLKLEKKLVAAKHEMLAAATKW